MNVPWSLRMPSSVRHSMFAVLRDCYEMRGWCRDRSSCQRRTVLASGPYMWSQ